MVPCHLWAHRAGSSYGGLPLSSWTLQQRSPASLCCPGFFLDSLLAGCVTLAPSRLSSWSEPQPSHWGLTSEAWASGLNTHLPQQASRQVSQAGECCSALVLHAGISPFCPLHPCCCPLLEDSETAPTSPQVSGLHSVWKLFQFHSSLWEGQVCPNSFVSLFFVYPTQLLGDCLAFWEVWGLLPAFSRCSVRVVPHVEVFLMYLGVERWYPRLTPLPSWRSLIFFFNGFLCYAKTFKFD